MSCQNVLFLHCGLESVAHSNIQLNCVVDVDVRLNHPAYQLHQGHSFLLLLVYLSRKKKTRDDFDTEVQMGHLCSLWTSQDHTQRVSQQLKLNGLQAQG